MSLILSAELAAACSALGSYDAKTNSYYGDDNTLETVKDLIRYLRRDTESHEVRRHFGASKILQVNLIPLLKLYWQQTDLFDVLLRLLGNLTSPVLLLYNEEIPKEKVVRNHFLQILGHLQSYKEAFADYDLWAVLCTRLSQLLNVEWQERGEENSLIIERILILVRNVLNVPADPDAEKRPDNDVSAHDKVLWSLRKSGLVDIILYMVSSEQEESYYMYLLEILSLMLREHRPADLANVAITRSQSEKTQDEAEFLAVRRQEMDRKNERIRSFTSARHSRFGGTFVVKNLKSVNDSQELIYHKSLNKANVLDFDADKSRVKLPKNRLPVQESSSFRRSTFSIRLLLKDFCVEFLNAGYNRLMHNVRGKLLRGKSASHDETYYLWALRFFMEFNRLHKTDVKLVSETMSNEIFHYVQQQMENNFDMITSDKKKWPLWSKRLHLAVQAYKELLLNLISMETSADDSIRESARVIKGNVFYVLEYREFILTLMLTYSPLKLSHAYLLDLIETQHIFLKMLQGYCGRDNSVVVQRKQKAKRTTKKKKKQQQVAAAPQISVEEYLQNKWDELASQLTTVLEGGENIPVISPFDASSDIPIDEQKKDAMIRIQNYLRDDEIENSIGLLRSAREVWPENDSFGGTGMAPEEEFMAIREIFFAELQDRNPIPTQHQTTVNEEDGEEEDEEEDELHDGQDAPPSEVDFKFQDFVSRFVHPKVVQACGLALRHFDTNPIAMNHFILKLLHRIAWDCKMPAMVFQASIFRTFQRIFAERHRPQHKELVKFAIFIVRQFVKVAGKNKKVFMELLFWKNSRDAYDIEEGYGSYQHKSLHAKAVWSEQEEEELRVLVMEHKQKEIDEDPIDWIVSNLIDNTKTRRMVIKKLKQMMLLDYKGPKKTSRVPVEWDEAEVVQLTELFSQFREASDPMGCILDRLHVKRPRPRVVLKLLELGLIQDANEVKKKRISKADRRLEEGITSRENIDSDADVNSTEDENPENIERSGASISSAAGSSSQKARKPKQSKASSKKASKPRQVDVKISKKLLLDVTNKGMSNALQWIVENLTEAAEDLEQEIDLDNNEGVPLVPIGEDHILAMDNALFKRTLTALGIQKPANEQEIYWRIPGYLTADDLQRTCSIINGILENGAAAIEEEPAPTPASTTITAPDAESSDEDVFDRLRNFIAKPDSESLTAEESSTLADDNASGTLVANDGAAKKKGRIARKAVQSDNSSDAETNTADDDIISDSQISNTNDDSQKEAITNTKNKKTKRVQIQEDSDESDVEANRENEQLIENTANDSVVSRKGRRVNVLEESDESDMEETNDDTGSIAKRARASDSDSDSTKLSVKRKRVIIDSDDE